MERDRLDELDRRMRQRAARHREEREQAAQELFGQAPRPADSLPDLSEMVPAEAIAAYDDWVVARIGPHRGQVPAPAPPATPRTPVAGQIARVRSLADVDEVMISTFRLDRFLTGGASSPPTVFCTTPEEFVEPLAAYLGVPPTTRESWLAAARQETPGWEKANPLARNALYIPHLGCYLNGWHLAREHRLPGPADALTDPPAFRDAVRHASSEKWGFGFIARHAAYRVERVQYGLDCWDLAARLGVHLPGDPPPAQQAREVGGIGSFTEVGWALWIGEYLAWHADPAPDDLAVQRGFRLAQLWDAAEHLARVMPLDEVVGGLLDAIRWLFLHSETGPALIHKGIRVLQVLQRHRQADRIAMAVCGMPFRALVGRLLISKLEARLGVTPLPYAVLIAGNLTFDLARSDPAAIERRVTQHPRQNVDTRLAMLSFLDPTVKYDVATMVAAARHEFEIEPPPVLCWA